MIERNRPKSDWIQYAGLDKQHWRGTKKMLDALGYEDSRVLLKWLLRQFIF